MKLYEGFRNVPVEYLYEDHGIVYYRIGSGVFGFVPEKVSVDEFRDTVALMSDSMEKVQFLHENATLVGYDRTKMPKAMRGLYEARGRRRLREDDEAVSDGDEFEDAEDPLEGKSEEAVAKLKYAVQRPFRREFAWRPRGPRMPVREVAGYSIKPADRRVIAAFLHKNAASGNGLESDGQKLRSTAMGRTLVAYWAKDDALYLGRPEGNVSQTWINAVKRAARDAGVQIWESRKRPIRERYGLRDRPPIRWASKKDAQQFVDIGWKSNNYESASSDAWDRAVDAVWDAYKSGVADEEQLSLIVKDELDRTATTERRLARSNYLASTDDSPNVEWKVKEAASQILGVPGEYISTTFEHGNWWVTLPNGAVYDVVDAEGGSSVNGFDLEMVTEPSEDEGEYDESKKPVKEADDTYQRGEEGEVPSEKLRYLRRMVRRLQNAGATQEEIETQISQEYPDVPEHLRQALLAGGGR